MTGFDRLDVGASTSFKDMWFRLDDEERKIGTLRVEFHNRKNPGGPGAVYDYQATKELVDGMIEHAQTIGGPSFGSLFHSTVVKHPELYPYTLVRKAE